MDQPASPIRPAKKWTLQYPELGTGPVPHAPNVSAAYFEREREKLFKRTWLLLCREEEVAHPGSYAVKQVPILETSVLLVRGDDGVVRAFHRIAKGISQLEQSSTRRQPARSTFHRQARQPVTQACSRPSGARAAGRMHRPHSLLITQHM